MVKASGLLEPTKGAPVPVDDTAGVLAIFGIQEAGQLEIANKDKKGALGILDTCEEWQRKAAIAAKGRTWWKAFG